MAHTTRKVNLGNTAVAVINMTAYTVGGESFTLTEFGLTGSLVNVLIINVENNPTNNIQEVYEGAGVVKLFDACTGKELPTTASMNYYFVAIVQGT